MGIVESSLPRIRNCIVLARGSSHIFGSCRQRDCISNCGGELLVHPTRIRRTVAWKSCIAGLPTRASVPGLPGPGRVGTGSLRLSCIPGLTTRSLRRNFMRIQRLPGVGRVGAGSLRLSCIAGLATRARLLPLPLAALFAVPSTEFSESVPVAVASPALFELALVRIAGTRHCWVDNPEESRLEIRSKGWKP